MVAYLGFVVYHGARFMTRAPPMFLWSSSTGHLTVLQINTGAVVIKRHLWSTDFNPIEHYWDVVESLILILKVQPNTIIGGCHNIRDPIFKEGF